MAAILTPALTAEAFAAVRPSLETAIASGLASRGDVDVAVAAVARIRPWPATPHGFHETCLLVAEIGDLSRSAYPNRRSR